jgi:hypothetical protein
VPKIRSIIAAAAFVAAGSLAAPAIASAQHAVVRARPIARPGFRSSVVFVGGFGFGYPQLYEPWGYPYSGYGYGPYPGYWYDDVASLRLEIKPKQAEVFIDGYRAGVVDNFDGIFQRLHVRPGGHDLVVYLPGFRTFEAHVYASPGSSQSVKMNLLPLAPGETLGPPPLPAPPQAQPMPGPGRGMRMMPPVQIPNGEPAQGGAPPQPPQPNEVPPPPSSYRVPPPQPQPPPQPNDVTAPAPPTDPSAYGTLSLRVQPTDGAGTQILIDGERWQTPSSSDRLLVRLAEGKHHVEIRRPGFATFVTDVTIQRGNGTPLNVNLVRR